MIRYNPFGTIKFILGIPVNTTEIKNDKNNNIYVYAVLGSSTIIPETDTY